jgi:hypothetical protein
MQQYRTQMTYYRLTCADAADPEVCPEEDKERAKSDQNCGFLLSDSSPFKACKE